MAGKGKAPRAGKALQDQVVALAQQLGLSAESEVRAARRIWGAKRRIDVVLRHPDSRQMLGIECKYQSTRGSAEEKIPSTIKDIEFWPIPGIVVIAGDGFSDNMKGYLMATGKAVWLTDLEDWLRLYFALV